MNYIPRLASVVSTIIIKLFVILQHCLRTQHHLRLACPQSVILLIILIVVRTTRDNAPDKDVIHWPDYVLTPLIVATRLQTFQ